MIRLSDLRDKPIRTLDGNRLGRVHEVHCEQGRIVALMCGARSLIERLTARTEGRRIPWESVMRIEKDAVVIAASAPRTRQGIRRPSERRSKH